VACYHTFLTVTSVNAPAPQYHFSQECKGFEPPGTSFPISKMLSDVLLAGPAGVKWQEAQAAVLVAAETAVATLAACWQFAC